MVFDKVVCERWCVVKVEYFNMFGELCEYYYQYGMETHIHGMKMDAHNRVLEREK